MATRTQWRSFSAVAGASERGFAAAASPSFATSPLLVPAAAAASEAVAPTDSTSMPARALAAAPHSSQASCAAARARRSLAGAPEASNETARGCRSSRAFDRASARLRGSAAKPLERASGASETRAREATSGTASERTVFLFISSLVRGRGRERERERQRERRGRGGLRSQEEKETMHQCVDGSFLLLPLFLSLRPLSVFFSM